MPYWMKHPHHGEMPLYDMGEVERHKKLGWDFVNDGPSPNRPPKNAPADDVEVQDEARVLAPGKRGLKSKA